jgi:hypothetical protein
MRILYSDTAIGIPHIGLSLTIIVAEPDDRKWVRSEFLQWLRATA